MKRTLRGIVLVTILTIVISIANIANAFSFGGTLTSNDKLVAGQEVKVTLSLNNIDMGDGIRSIKVGKVSVGNEFDGISSASFSSSTFTPTYSNGGLVLMAGNPVTANGAVVTLTLKVKDGITAKSAVVKFENIVASSGTNTGDISIGTKTVTINADSSAVSGDESGTTTPTTPATSSNKNTSANTTKNTAKKTTKNTIQSSKTTAKRILNAGDATTMAIVAVVAVVAIVGCLGFIRYSKNKDIK